MQNLVRSAVVVVALAGCAPSVIHHVAPTAVPIIVAAPLAAPSVAPFTNHATPTKLAGCPRGYYAYVLPLMDVPGNGNSIYYCSPLTVAQGGDTYGGGGVIGRTVG